MDLKKIYNKNREIVLYAMIGGSAVVIDVLIFAFCNEILDLKSLIANSISVSIVTIWSFVLNAKFNFKKTDNIGKRALSFILVSGAGYLLSQAIIYYFTNIQDFNPTLVKLGSLIPVVILQFILNKYISFKEY